MSGIVGLVLAFAAKFWANNNVPDKWLWSACASCIFVAMYRAWLKEHDRAELAGSGDVSSLHEANTGLRNRIDELETQLRPRRLNEQQKTTLIRVLSEGLTEQARNWPEDAKRTPLVISVISVGSEQETLDYRNDFADVIEAGGFETVLEQWNPATSDLEQFRGAVTLIERDARNIICPIFVSALRAAGINVRSSPYPSLGSAPTQRRRATALLRIHINRPAVEIVIGQRSRA
jgi:hypothetical protein